MQKGQALFVVGLATAVFASILLIGIVYYPLVKICKGY